MGKGDREKEIGQRETQRQREIERVRNRGTERGRERV